MVDLLQELIARSYLPAEAGGIDPDMANPNEDQPGVKPGSLLESWLGKKKKAAFGFLPPPQQQQLPAWGQQAGILAPGVGQLGNMDPGTTGAPTNPTDPNYVTPQMAATPDDIAKLPQWLQKATTGGQPIPKNPDIPLPQARPAEADDPNATPPDATPQVAKGKQVAPSTPREASGEPIPAPRSAVDSTRGQRDTPPESTPVQGGQPSFLNQAAPQAGMLSGLGDIGSKFLQNLHEHSNLLLAMGAGFAGAPNIGQGISRAAAYAGPAAQADLRMGMQTGAQQAAFNALVSAGVPRNLAMAGATNPDIMKQLVGQYMVAPKYEVKPIESTNMWGEKTTKLLAMNPNDPLDSYDAQTGAPVGPHAGAGMSRGPGGMGLPQQAGAAGGVPGGGVAPTRQAQPMTQPSSGFFAPGVTEDTYNPNLIGEDYINQFSPEVKQSVINYLHGNTSMTGRQLPLQRIKMIAGKYGHDIGMEADENRLNQRRAYETQLATPDRGVGKQKKGFQQGLEHFADISDSLVQMHLSNGFNAPGGEKAAEWANWYKSLSPDQQNLITHTQGLAGFLAREMGNMSGGTGVHEATAAAERLGGTFRSGKAAAGALEAARDIIDGSLQTMQNNRDELFPDERYRPTGSNFKGARQQELLDKIDRNIKILKGEAKAPAAAAPGAAPAAAPQGAKVAPGNYHFDQYGNPVQ